MGHAKFEARVKKGKNFERMFLRLLVTEKRPSTNRIKSRCRAPFNYSPHRTNQGTGCWPIPPVRSGHVSPSEKPLLRGRSSSIFFWPFSPPDEASERARAAFSHTSTCPSPRGVQATKPPPIGPPAWAPPPQTKQLLQIWHFSVGPPSTKTPLQSRPLAAPELGHYLAYNNSCLAPPHHVV